jgi:DNA repair protein RadC
VLPRVPKKSREAASAESPPGRGAGLQAHEQAVIDAALAILASRMRADGALFCSPSTVKDYLTLHLAGREREAFAVLYLDTRQRLLAFEVPFAGTLTHTSVHPREIVRRALDLNAAAVILAHNHPSGVAEPSRADELLTQGLRAALQLVDVRVLDHVIVAGRATMSFAERGLL